MSCEDDNNVNEVSNGPGCSKIHPLSLVNIFDKGDVEMQQMNLVELRKRIKSRNQRHMDYQEKIYNSVMANEEKIENKIEQLKLRNEYNNEFSVRTMFRILCR